MVRFCASFMGGGGVGAGACVWAVMLGGMGGEREKRWTYGGG